MSAGLGARIESLLSWVRVGRFLSVGAVGAVCDNAVLALLSLGFDVTPEVAKLVGAETAILLMFVLNERWTFAGAGDATTTAVLRRLLTSNLVRLGGVLVAVAVFSLVLRSVPIQLLVFGVDVWLIVANGVGILVGMVVNYVLESTLTWRVTGADG
ncbi:GtrA family protein [Halomarina pelagica]|uniref:GtrA family protein n=1 Tax=Halomarina pelagica TaxID=2961599 RepID=UPI0020C36E6C|nr:GtrA family protein [Halomarina sp. BND7]